MSYPRKKIELEETELYCLIAKATKTSIKQAWRLAAKITPEEVKQRSDTDKSTYLHHIVNQAPVIHKKSEEVTLLVPLIYRLAMRGMKVNAQNAHGNTCLQLACLRPHAEALCPHLLRIGGDPCIQNKKQCRVIHTFHNHRFDVVKGQESAKSGIWCAVDREDYDLTEKLLKTWCRVQIRKNKSLMNVAEETANLRIIRLLQKYDVTNELVCAAFANDATRVKELVRLGADINTCDHAYDVSKPLMVALQELSEGTSDSVRMLQSLGADSSQTYEDQVIQMQDAFEESEYYRLLMTGSDESLQEALDLIQARRVNLQLVSRREDTLGWSYLHLTVDRYHAVRQESEDRSRMLIRAMYRLALSGLDVNVRDAHGSTAMVLACRHTPLDQNLLTHLIRIGVDAHLADKSGRAVNEEVYQDKGKLVFDKRYREADLPGLWVAVDCNDICKAERWLKSWCRVTARKGERILVEVARAQKRQEIVRLLEEHEHINEFVCATFACDLKKMMDVLSLGKGQKKVNTIDDFFHVGFTWDRHAEFMARPIVIAAMEICTPEVVDFLLKFGANLGKEYEESAPCGPVAFWAYRDHVTNDNALVVANHADVNLRDEEGATMLHKAIKKTRTDGKLEIIEVLLERGVPVYARDWEGCTARDYITIHDVVGGDELKQIIDNHVVELANTNQHYMLETLLLEGYDHVTEVRGTKKNKTCREIAELKEFKDIIELLDEWDSYREEVELLHRSAQSGDIRTVSKLSGEKRCAWGRDMAGRTLLHQAVLYEDSDCVKFLLEQYPNLVNTRDNRNRTPLHLCVCLKNRHKIWPILQDGGADQNLIDANNMSVYEYVRELESPTDIKDRLRGRRWQNYRPENVIEFERNMNCGVKSRAYNMKEQLMDTLRTGDLADVKKLTQKHTESLALDDLDLTVSRKCVDSKREQILKHLITSHTVRPHVTFKVATSGGEEDVTLLEHADKANMTDAVNLIKSIPVPKDEDVQSGEDVIQNGEMEQSQDVTQNGHDR